MPKDKSIERVFNEHTIERFLSKLRQGENGCIEWDGDKTSAGYGRFVIGGHDNKIRIPAHRWAMTLSHGHVFPSDVFACHTCDNPGCVNPLHLFPGTVQDNATDMVNKGRTATNFGNAKLDWETVDCVLTYQNVSGTEWAKLLDVSKATISEIRTRKIWRDEDRGKAILPRK